MAYQVKCIYSGDGSVTKDVGTPWHSLREAQEHARTLAAKYPGWVYSIHPTEGPIRTAISVHHYAYGGGVVSTSPRCDHCPKTAHWRADSGEESFYFCDVHRPMPGSFSALYPI